MPEPFGWNATPEYQSTARDIKDWGYEDWAREELMEELLTKISDEWDAWVTKGLANETEQAREPDWRIIMRDYAEVESGRDSRLREVRDRLDATAFR